MLKQLSWNLPSIFNLIFSITTWTRDCNRLNWNANFWQDIELPFANQGAQVAVWVCLGKHQDRKPSICEVSNSNITSIEGFFDLESV